MPLSPRLARGAVFLLACALTALLYAPRVGRWYTPDSFALHALGERWWQGEGYTTQAVRDLYLPPTAAAQPLPSRSFPPLLPALTGAINRVHPLGPGAGVLVGALSVAGLFAAASLPPFSAAPYALQCLTLFGFMVLNTGFVTELLGGRTVPLQALLLALTLHVALALRARPRAHTAVALGLLLAAAMLNRFDATPCALLLPAAAWALPGAPRPGRATVWCLLLLTYAALAVAYLPWAARNWQIFHTPFASDNAITALAVASDDGMPYPLAAVTTLATAPTAWAWQRLGFLLRNLAIVTLHPSSFIPWPLLLLPLLRRHAYPLQTRQHALLALGVLGITLTTVSLTPYPGTRYFTAAACAVWCVLPTLVPRAARWAWPPRWVGAWAAAVAGVLAVGLMRFDGAPWGLSTCSAECARYREARSAFAPWIGEAPAGWVASRVPDTLAHYTGWRTLALPYRTPGHASDYATWLRDWRPRYAVLEGSDLPPRSHALARSSQGLTLVEFAL